ncbi:MAG TPA: ATP-grasp domain-containing protein [Patescibacteria group bacterium]|nr:ATP-grasp domain-containing protein [Patescibacteria group bacterium]
MRVALAYNVKKNKPSSDLSKQTDLEFDLPYVINEIKKSIEELGHTIIKVEADENAFTKLKKLKGKIDIVFNIAEGLWGEARETQIPIICEILKIPYTHSGPTTHTISLDKSFTNLILKGAEGINVPESHVVKEKNWVLPSRLKFPLIVKPNSEGSSKGVLDANVVNNQRDLKKRVEFVSEKFTKEVLIEEYVDGREFTVAVMGNEELTVLPIIEQKFDFLPKGMNKIASFELKWLYEDSLTDLHDAYDCPAKLSTSQRKEIERVTKEVYRILDVKDCARLDFRMNKKGKLYFIEINTIPGINPSLDGISYFPLAARTAGINYKEMVGKILEMAEKRYKILG